MNKIRTVFMGSPSFAIPSLQVLAETTEVVGVVCQPDKPSGRGLEQTAPAIKQAAEKHALPLFQPVSLRKDPVFLKQLFDLAPDLIVVVAYGKILPADVLNIPRLGCWNVHASLLPKYRGAAPIQWSLIHGETKTGVTLMKMDEGMDTGPTFFSQELDIQWDDTAETLHDKLSKLGALLLQKGLTLLQAGTLPLPQSQDSSFATMAPLLTKEHGLVDFKKPSVLVSGQIRGVTPWPGAYVTIPERKNISIKIFSPQIVPGNGQKGEVLGLDEHGLVIACAEGAVSIAEMQAPGKKRLPASAFLAGFPLPKGFILN